MNPQTLQELQAEKKAIEEKMQDALDNMEKAQDGLDRTYVYRLRTSSGTRLVDGTLELSTHLTDYQNADKAYNSCEQDLQIIERKIEELSGHKTFTNPSGVEAP